MLIAIDKHYLIDKQVSNYLNKMVIQNLFITEQSFSLTEDCTSPKPSVFYFTHSYSLDLLLNIIIFLNESRLSKKKYQFLTVNSFY